MMIVLNEIEWAEEAIANKALGKKPMETISRVAKYYIYKGYSKSETRKMLDIFLLQCDPSASLPKWSSALDFATNRAVKYQPIIIDHIDITVTEMAIIDSIKGKQARRLAFTLLCLAKYWDAVNPNCDHWVNNKDSDIMNLANINTSIKRQSIMYHDLNELGLVQFSKKVDNTNVRVCFIDRSDLSDVYMKITDFRNLGYQYLMAHGEPYFECQSCGVVSKIPNPGKGNNIKYCNECATAILTQQKVNSAMRRRAVKQRAIC